MRKADIGLIGLAVMGQNLALNMDERGFRVVVFNRTVSKVDEFLAGPAEGTVIAGARSLEALAAALERPRAVVLMVKAGPVVDRFIEGLLPHFDEGDVIVDGGNSLYADSGRRAETLARRGVAFIGAGISGGEEGARHGPSIMPGGNPAAWPRVREIFQAISAKVDGEPCCRWVGDGGSGHYVKMVHNGIEYGDMQLICEAWHLMREGLGLEAGALSDVFAQWQRGVLDSYLIEITSDILGRRDEDGAPLVDRILDAAGQKGTGKWAVASALELGTPLTLIGEAVFARCLSAMKDERVRAAARLGPTRPPFEGDREAALGDVHDALYAAKIVSYAQGFALMRAAAAEHGWELRHADVAAIWRGGCIIRSRFLDNIRDAFEAAPDLENLLLDEFFARSLREAEPGWRRTVHLGVDLALPLPAMASALSWYDAYRSARLPANLLQAQRDYFGAHTYERVDRPRGERFHTDWTGSGGPVSSTAYEV